VDHNRRIPDPGNNHDEEGVPEELMELGRLIETATTAQRTELDSAFQKVVDSVRRRRRILALVQEALSQLRLDIKYLMFDLDATRKERNELREQLEDR
jgi:hypothetical protein